MSEHKEHGESSDSKLRATRNGVNVPWKLILSVLTSLSVGTMGGGALHASLYGSPGEDRKEVKDHEERLTATERRVDLIEQRIESDRKAQDERDERAREDLREIKAGLQHLTDLIEQPRK